MTVKLFTDYKPESKWEKLILRKADEIADEISCELLVARPGFTEQVTAHADEQILAYLMAQGDGDQHKVAALAHQRSRINLVVQDWRGVSDGTNDVPYSLGMLEMLCSQYPQLLDDVNRIVNDVLVTYPGDLEKNLPSPPVVGGTETTIETTISTESLTSFSDLQSGSGSGDYLENPSTACPS